MSEGRESESVTVMRDGVHVEKSFDAEEFPVPAVTFTIWSDRESPIRVRLVDTIPDSFPMDRVGFHPDFESEHWTAYKDNRVEFEREFDPDESITTVYGIRAEDLSDVDRFLDEPTIETMLVSEASGATPEEIEAVLGGDDGDPVREVIAGDREGLPGMGAESDDAAASQTAVATAADSAFDDDDAESTDDEPEPLELDDPTADDPEASAADSVQLDEEDDVDVDVDEENVDDGDADEDHEPIELDDPDTTADTEASAQEAVESESAPEPRSIAEEPTPAVTLHTDDSDDNPAEDESDITPTEAESDITPTEAESNAMSAADVTAEAEPARTDPALDSVASALAREIRAGTVPEDDLDVLRDELDVGPPDSVDVRIRRLQSTVSDVAAYTDALEEFLDEEGTAREVLDGLQADISDLQSTLSELDIRTDDAATERERIEDRVSDVADDVSTVERSVYDLEDEVGSFDERFDSIESTVDHLGADVEDLSAGLDELENLEDDVEALEGDVDHLDAEVDTVRTDVTDVDDRVDDVEAQLETRLETAIDTFEADIAALESEIEELQSFRDNLSDAFGG